ncbi:MAG TPA: M23 family metallopeptidase [Anaerolineales bacterium]|nr:M23 family metallopeptidase [Anaerolineales bacterium]
MPAGVGLSMLVVTLLMRTSVEFPAPQVEDDNLAPIESPVELPTFNVSHETTYIHRRTLPHTDIPERGRMNTLTYSVQLGDTAWSIAEQFELQPETILWGNAGLSSAAGSLQIGQELKILPVDGVLHTVEEGDTIEGLAALYDVAPGAILEFPGNGFTTHGDATLLPGRELIIPGGTKAIAWVEPGPRVLAGQGRRSPGFYSGPLVYIGTGTFQWPVSPIRITQSYWSGHQAIDLDTYFRQPVFASDSGTVIYSKWDSTGYGNLIIVDHGNGLWSYYAHNEANLVTAGDGVVQGQQIAESGSTGNSTGDHLDFRIRLVEGGFLNPLDYLP